MKVMKVRRVIFMSQSFINKRYHTPTYRRKKSGILSKSINVRHNRPLQTANKRYNLYSKQSLKGTIYGLF